jgi:hypothetical protein
MHQLHVPIIALSGVAAAPPLLLQALKAADVTAYHAMAINITRRCLHQQPHNDARVDPDTGM